MKATKLRGMPVVSVDTAEKVGEVRDVLVDTEAQRLVALEMKGKSSARGTTVPVDAVHSVGKDAITVKGVSASGEFERGTTEPAGADRGDFRGDVVPLDKILGAKALSESGNVLGNVDEVDYDPSNFHIISYELGAGGLSKITGEHRTVKLSQGMRYANGILIVPDEGREIHEGRERHQDHAA